MALLTLIALFFSFDFAVIGAALLLRAFVASNDQVNYLKGAVPRGTVLNINRADILNVGKVSAAVHGVTIAIITAPSTGSQPSGEEAGRPSTFLLRICFHQLYVFQVRQTRSRPIDFRRRGDRQRKRPTIKEETYQEGTGG